MIVNVPSGSCRSSISRTDKSIALGCKDPEGNPVDFGDSFFISLVRSVIFKHWGEHGAKLQHTRPGVVNLRPGTVLALSNWLE
jgi:hypothetical protein